MIRRVAMNDSEKIFTGERFVPGIDDDEITIEHFQRYKTVLDLVKNKVVLDAACGEGYGSSIIGTVANQVIGIDLNGEAIDRATANYGNDKVSFLTASVAELPIESNSIDVVVSFETIEHVPEEVQIEFIKEVRRVLKEDGLFIISSPNRAIYSDLFDYHNEFHVHELYKDEFESMLREHFRNIKLFNQYWEVASVIDNNDTYQEKATFVKDRKKYTSDGKYFIALASNADVTDLCLESIYLKEGVTYRSNMLRIVELQDEVERRNAHLKELDDEISRKDAEIVRLQGEEEARNKHIAVLDHNIELMDQNIQTLKRNSELQDAVISAKDASIVTLKEQLSALKEKSDEFEYLKDKAESAVHDKDVHIRNLSAMIEQLNIDILTLNHQINLKENHIQNIEGGYKRWVRISENPLCRAIRAPKKIAAKAYHRIKDGDGIERLVIPKWDKPIVSIVIPVYNQFEYTHACVKSIIETVEDIPYEIIIGDDESTDATRKIKKYINGIRVNMNTSDHGFLMNCNHAAKLARGEYIVFLNNDTQVKEEWLSSLLELIKSDNKIGMVGSKLIYPDGRLQEAGGIIWSDASGWNYGREQNPDMPEYNYVRECDYISGASIMLRRELWEEIGGFDERYKPAYCEDSDLAFQVRKKGYKVMYQPKSVVVHYEGVSNGTDLESGLKKYQVENNKKFKEKWAEELRNQYDSGQVPFCARERNHGKKIILIIDHYVPTFDKDAGSKTTFQYIKMFIEKGYIVKFVGDNYAQMEPYTTVLQQMGVEVLYGSWYAEHIFEWIYENQKYITIAYLNRPHISEKYVDFLKEKTNIKLIYYGHDLHFLRIKREAELTNDKELFVESNIWKQKEFDIMKKVSMVYYPSCIEEEAIHEIDPTIPVKAITAYVYEKFLENYKYIPAERKGILFVGGFSHGPNIDAVEWFVDEIYSQIREKANIPLYIVGSNAPDDIKALDGDGIVFKGFVSDEELAKLYANCKIVVVPLRYGAGVKGKVVEAIYNGAPIITTSVGAEGIPGVEEVVCVEDDPNCFAERIMSLYQDDEKLIDMAQKTQQFIKEKFSIDAVWNIVKDDFQ